MRIAHLDTGREWRGGQAQVLHLARGLAARGHACLLLAPPGPLLERAAAAGIATRTWRPRVEWDVVAMLRAAGELRRFGAEVAHCHSAHAHATGQPHAQEALLCERDGHRKRDHPSRPGLRLVRRGW